MYCDNFGYYVKVIVYGAMIVGTIITAIVHIGLRYDFYKRSEKNKWKVPLEVIEPVYWQPIMIGVFERVVFTIVASNDNVALSNIFTAVFAWIGLKLVTGWNRLQGQEVWRRYLAFNAVINSLISIMIGILYGLWILSEVGNYSPVPFRFDGEFACLKHTWCVIFEGILCIAFSWFVAIMVEKKMRDKMNKRINDEFIYG